jgi:hypothetical protein
MKKLAFFLLLCNTWLFAQQPSVKMTTTPTPPSSTPSPSPPTAMKKKSDLKFVKCENVDGAWEICTACEDADRKINCKTYACDYMGNCTECDICSPVTKAKPPVVLPPSQCELVKKAIATNNAELQTRYEQLKATKGVKGKLLMTAAQSPTKKPIYEIIVPSSVLSSDSVYSALKNKSVELNKQKTAINCQ